MKTRISHLALLVPTVAACFVMLFATSSLAAVLEPNKVSTELNKTEPNKPPATARSAVTSTETAVDSVAVTINGVDIKESQIETRLKPQLQKMATQLPLSFIEQYKKQLRQQVLEGMIIEQLLDEKVKAAKIVVTANDVNNLLSEMVAAEKLSMDDFKALIEATGRSFEQWKQQWMQENRIEKGLTYQKLMETQWAGKINVTEDDAKKYYDENAKQLEQIRASHILIKPRLTDPNADPNKAKAAAKAKAQDLLKQIKDGADFTELARANSDYPSSQQGGDLGFFSRGQTVLAFGPAFEEAAFALKPGQVSDIIETQSGYHIIKVTDHKNDTFEKAKDYIMKQLTQTKQADFAREYIESLKTDAKIVYPPGKEPNAPAAGPAIMAPPRPDNKPVPEPEEKTSVKKKTSDKKKTSTD
jgi:peptidyl-prolyl cis-trans isomerase C